MQGLVKDLAEVSLDDIDYPVHLNYFEHLFRNLNQISDMIPKHKAKHTVAN